MSFQEHLLKSNRKETMSRLTHSLFSIGPLILIQASRLETHTTEMPHPTTSLLCDLWPHLSIKGQGTRFCHFSDL